MQTHLSTKTVPALRTGSLNKLLWPLLLLALPSFLNGCQNPPAPTAPNQNAVPTPSPSASPTPTGTAFDGQRAFEHVRKQVEFGPHPAGSEELAKTREYIIGELKSYGLNVTTDEWKPQTPVGVRQMVNVTAELPGESSDVIIISSHYDTKLFKEFQFVGADDGGSSTGALMELARVLATSGQKPRFTYWFVFFDGEEAFCKEWEQCKNNGEPDNTYGSRHFVAQLKMKNEVKRVRAMILLDMIGFKDLEFGRDDDMSTKWLVDTIWDTAKERGYGRQFLSMNEGVGGDDHEPFVKAGIDSVDIIQLASYPYWHTADDTLDKISPQSLKIVGEVVLASLPRIEQRLQK
jgi:Zn-dependent M28 family amino/carboxypeptidase